MCKERHGLKFGVILFLSSLASVCGDNQTTCCLPDQGVLMDGEDFCENALNDTLTPLHLKCAKTNHILSQFFNFSVQEDGSLNIREEVDSIIFGAGEFCIAERTVNDTEGVLVLCDSDGGEGPTEGDSVVDYCLLVAVVFLALTALIYCILPEVRDLQGKSIISFCICLAIALTLLFLIRVVQAPSMEVCGIRAFFTYFFFIASFFWTNAISIQIFLGIKKPIIHDYGWKNFIFYSIYAWGCPALLTTCLAIINYYPGSWQGKPSIGKALCWFGDRYQLWYYLYSVMAIIIILNTFFFIWTSVYLWRQSFSSTHIKAMRYKALMTLKLYIIMGLPWVFDMISSLFDKHIIWTILDVFNALQGPLIFLIFVVFRRRVIKALYKRGYLDCMSGVVERHLAVAEDDEDVVQHTTHIGLEDK